ncbi:ER lumen protein retaining receptor [Ordospora colligata]|uniref:ER lumen protein-retaining receptor n=1 Tax=Ordospora colligata OC4 TaxID=1354746 RepID=A0A0B2UKF7_9MICR|nr:ER lumen protein retaining receptor [Ordospora colligata OC4]KHN69495.1 ER lumen protein retaining receptor [Ordospora colligata OC4]TBU15239.1 ER lumen protein retaining receptor [Ordospora colligata]TBU15310.1 ER lumen protein retaining receptor [Ordospora colligata]TBU18493.1 ER lumen protein retaining receptor [Ordospora colligata]
MSLAASYYIKQVFRFTGDFLHIASKVVLIRKISRTKSCSGLSLKTQFLYGMVFVLRYIDLFRFYPNSLLSVYNSLMKILFIGFQALILFTMRFKYFGTYDRKWDKFNILMLIIPCFLISMIFTKSSSGAEEFSFVGYAYGVTYTMSLLLESVAILPQLVQLQEAGESETMTSRYILLLGLYRAAYTVYFAIRKIFEEKDKVPTSLPLACGIIQTLLYVDFFAIYYRYVFRRSGISDDLGKKSEL